MISSKVLMLLTTMYLLSGTAQAAQTPPTEAQCRQMVNGMVQTMKSTPLEKERDKQRAQAVLDRVEKVVKDNRSRKASECESWAAISKIVTTQ